MGKLFLTKKSEYYKGVNRFFLYWVYFIFFIVLIIISGFRLLGYGRDDINYLSKEQYLENFTILNFIIQEPIYWLILALSKYILNNIFFQFLFFSIVHIGILFFVIKRYSINISISLLTYLFFFFLLHGYTQIRVSIAVSIFLFAIHYLFLERRLKYIIIILTSILFHYSSIIYFAFSFIRKNKINKYFYFFLPVLGILLGIVLNTSVLESFLNKLYLPNFISFKLIRSIKAETENNPNLINSFLILKLLIYWISILKINYIYKINKYSIIYVKILGLSIFIFYALKSIPVLGFRISEMLSTVLILYIPVFLKVFKEKYIVTTIFIVIGIFIFLKSYKYLFFQGM